MALQMSHFQSQCAETICSLMRLLKIRPLLVECSIFWFHGIHPSWWWLIWTNNVVLFFYNQDAHCRIHKTLPSDSCHDAAMSVRSVTVYFINHLAYTAACEAVWATDVLLLILAFFQEMALHVIYRFKAEKTIYRMVYHTYRLHQFLGYKLICTASFAKKWVCQRVKINPLAAELNPICN
jgi:hypothetical protein